MGGAAHARADLTIAEHAWAVVRSAYCWVALALLTLVVGSLTIAVCAFVPASRWARRLEMAWVWTILRASNVKLTSEGLEHVTPGRSYIVMANHRSMYDIPVLHYLLGRDRDLRWIAKQELQRVPVFGWAYRASRHVAIDRENRVAAIETLRQAAAASREGVTFVIMPEGTRSRSGELLPFKKGGFHLALDTGLPILPVAILGSERLMRKGSWYILAGAIHVRVRPPIETRGLARDDIDGLAARVREEIAAALMLPLAERSRR